MVGQAEISAPSMWPQFKVSVPDPVLGEVYSGKAGMTPEQSLVEFMSTSASYHGVKKQQLRSLEWDLLKVLTHNVMPANAAAWYMAKRKFYMNQSFDQQLLPSILKKYPDKFKIVGNTVFFLEVYNKDVARQKLEYLVKFGLDAYFTHKAEEFGVYFFDPVYYENTEPFNESLRQCTNKSGKGKLVTKYFNQEGTRQKLTFKQHSSFLVSICKQPGVKVVTNTTGVVVSMINSQYGYIKFGSAETALFSVKSLFRDGWHFTGDPMSLPAMKFDGYQIPDSKGDKAGRSYSWYAVLVWCGRRPSPKFCSTAEDLNSTPGFREGRLSTVSSQGEGRKLRQPSSSMMVGQVVEIRRNGAVLSVREDGPDKVFVPGWKRQLASRPGVTWLSTDTGECIGMGDLVAYYVDTEIRPGFSAVGKNVMVLKEKEEAEMTDKKVRRRRRRKSTELSDGLVFEDSMDGRTSEDDGNKSEVSVSEGELEWLDKDLASLIAKEDPAATTMKLLMDVHNQLQAVRTPGKKKKSNVRRDEVGYTPMVDQDNYFWRMKKIMASLESGYRSDSDSDYNPGDRVEEVRRPNISLGDAETANSYNTSLASTSAAEYGRKRNLTAGSSASSVTGVKDKNIDEKILPFWVRAVSLPEKFDLEIGKFVPVDSAYNEEKDPDYVLPETDYEDVSEEEGIKIEDLINEAEVELPEDLLEGKHRSAAGPATSPVKVTLTPVKEGYENDREDQVVLVDDVPVEILPQPSLPMWAKKIGLIDLCDEYDSEEDPEYVPAGIVDSDVDYDEYSEEDQDEMSKELSCLVCESSGDLAIPSTYIPIWVIVDSALERIARAKEEVEHLEVEVAAKEGETSGKDTDHDMKVDNGSVEKDGGKPKRIRKRGGKTLSASGDGTESVGDFKQVLPGVAGCCEEGKTLSASGDGTESVLSASGDGTESVEDLKQPSPRVDGCCEEGGGNIFEEVKMKYLVEELV